MPTIEQLIDDAHRAILWTGGDMPIEVSGEMQLAVAYAKAHGNKLVRYPGGFWTHDREAYLNEHAGRTFGATTVAALVRRGVMRYSKMQGSGRHGEFPIEATLTEGT